MSCEVMSCEARKLSRLLLAALAGCAVLAANERWPLDPDASLVSGAEARVGRPLTPMSYAGVARRTTRRAVVATTPVVVAPAPVPVAPRCVQAVDAYGRIYTRCY